MAVQIARHPDQAGVYRLTSELILPATRESIFEFFGDAHQLERITPPWLRFRVLTEKPIAMQGGTLIDYRLRLHGIPIRWRTKISNWDPPFQFIDEQLVGPYRRWEHLHTFDEVNGKTICRDRVDYAVPGGRLAHKFLVAPDLRKIFEYRHQQLSDIFHGASGRSSAGSKQYVPTS